jgi:hypothetical protein
VDRLVTFFYSGEYHNSKRDEGQQEWHNPHLDLNVNTIADKYAVQILKGQSEVSFKVWMAKIKDDEVNDDFVKVIDDVLGLEHQNNLVEAVFDLFVSKGPLFLKEEGIRAILISHPEFLLRLHRHTLDLYSNCMEEKEDLYKTCTEKIKEAKTSVKAAKARVQMANPSLGDVIEDLDWAAWLKTTT